MDKISVAAEYLADTLTLAGFDVTAVGCDVVVEKTNKKDLSPRLGVLLQQWQVVEDVNVNGTTFCILQPYRVHKYHSMIAGSAAKL